MSPRIDSALIAGGGTGGHVYPAVAVAEEILARNPDASILFIGSDHGLESRILPRLGYRLETITVSRLKGGSVLERIKGVARVPVGMYQSWRHLRRQNPQVVLGVGGYASGPALLAAWLTRRPTAIQEQNATPGMTNRVLGKLVRLVFVGFGAAGRHFAVAKLHVTGNPLRRSVADALAGAEARPAADPDALRILVFGGSQGARFLNENVPGALVALHAARPDLRLTVVHQTGPAEEGSTRARYAGTAIEAVTTVTPYIDDMPSTYATSDLAICRAGALTVAELTAVGLPSLLVPFPYAADNHQEANASVVVEASAGRMVLQSEWDDDDIASWLADFAADPERRVSMSRAARALAHPEAARAVVDHLEGIAK